MLIVLFSLVSQTKWIRTYLNDGVNIDTGVTVVPKYTFDVITTPFSIMFNRPTVAYNSITGYGVRWWRDSYKGHEVRNLTITLRPKAYASSALYQFVSHTGGLPGFSTIVGFLPADDLGIVILTNTAEQEANVKRLARRVIEEALGLDLDVSAAASDAVSSAQEADRGPNPPKHSQSASAPSLSLEKYTGNYTAPGYNNITLCAVTSTSPGCREALDAFSRFDELNSAENQYVLYAAYPALWSSHLRLFHVNGDDFSLAFTVLWPEGYGNDVTPFELWERGTGGVPAKFQIGEDPLSGETNVVALGILGLPEEQEGRKRLLRSVAGTDPGVSDIAQVLFTRVGPV